MDYESDYSEPYVDSGSEYIPSGTSSASSLASSSESSTLSIDVNEIAELEEEFSITNGYELKDIAKKSTHKVWEHFGILYKTNRIVSKTRDRLFCRKCFEKNTIKR